jgi:16S rRNA (cytidine1402-2'-O)-methyltransferase
VAEAGQPQEDLQRALESDSNGEPMALEPMTLEPMALGDSQALRARPNEVDIPTGLYLLSSPLGNLSDISQRFITIVTRAEVIAAEDTRRTLKILNHLGLKKRLYSYREANHKSMSPTLLRHLEEGDIVALISDAGAPGICDPGAFLVSEVRKANLAVFPIPGPSAVITALMASGFEASKFSFLGFLPPKREARLAAIRRVKDRSEVLVVFIPPHKLMDTLADLSAVLGSRKAFMAREMTKIHEEYLSLPLEALLVEVTQNPRRGEVTLVISPPETSPSHSLEEQPLSEPDLDLIKKDTRPTKDAAAYYATKFGRSKKEMYELIVKIRSRSQSEPSNDD